ncbi:hypothetical protein GpartN1_g6398.t1 [Galdieria partita]|uniref:DRBM domain-containing protein n=1 Tax=Galdieria partita TaxID=83374 RepID=A0A9C7Q3L2_9RHOD|nr:hypothetical protein GpartN1_g6398.t1 [Galdieria partita]
MSKGSEVLASFNFELVPVSFEKSPNKADSVLLNELCLLQGAKPKETFERSSASSWSCVLSWANMGPFYGKGTNKKEARNDASAKAVDYILYKVAPFVNHWASQESNKDWLPDNAIYSTPPSISILFLIDLDSCTQLVTQLVQLCRSLQLQKVSCQGFASKLYASPNLPKEVVVERADSTSKSSAAFLIAYRAGILAFKYHRSSWKPLVLILSRDFGLMSVAQMLEDNQFRVHFCCDMNQISQVKGTLIETSLKWQMENKS